MNFDTADCKKTDPHCILLYYSGFFPHCIEYRQDDQQDDDKKPGVRRMDINRRYRHIIVGTRRQYHGNRNQKFTLSFHILSFTRSYTEQLEFFPPRRYCKQHQEREDLQTSCQHVKTKYQLG